MITERLELPTARTTQTDRYCVPTVVDPSEIVVPAGWDSVGKILLVKEEFDVDSTSEGWDRDIHVSESENTSATLDDQTKKEAAEQVYEDTSDTEINKFQGPSAIKLYETTFSALQNEVEDEEEDVEAESDKKKQQKKLLQTKTDFQQFLSANYESLEKRIKEEENSRGRTSPIKKVSRHFAGSANDSSIKVPGMPEPMDMNVGGIHVESPEEVLRRLKVQEMATTNQPSTPSSVRSDSTNGASPYEPFNERTKINLASYDGSTPTSTTRIGMNLRGKPSQGDPSTPTPRSGGPIGSGLNRLGEQFSKTPSRLSPSEGVPANDKSQNAILANFFQTLLDKDTNSPNSSPSKRP